MVKSFTAIVLFDTSASHSYISRGFVDKYKLPTKVLRTPTLVSSLGAEYMASQGCFQMPLSIGRHVFPSDQIIRSDGKTCVPMVKGIWSHHQLAIYSALGELTKRGVLRVRVGSLNLSMNPLDMYECDAPVSKRMSGK